MPHNDPFAVEAIKPWEIFLILERLQIEAQEHLAQGQRRSKRDLSNKLRDYRGALSHWKHPSAKKAGYGHSLQNTKHSLPGGHTRFKSNSGLPLMPSLNTGPITGKLVLLLALLKNP